MNEHQVRGNNLRLCEEALKYKALNLTLSRWEREPEDPLTLLYWNERLVVERSPLHDTGGIGVLR
jgi:hypothetical protein